MDDDLLKIPGINGYLINKNGKVFSTKTNKYLSIHTNNKGYSYVTFSINGSNKNYLISRLLCFVFKDLPSLDSELEVDHINTNSLDNSLNNLQVLSRKEHRIKTDSLNLVSTRKVCTECRKPLHQSTVTYKCAHCNLIQISELEIFNAIKSTGSWVKAAELFNVSDSGLRKIYRRVSGKNPSMLKKQIAAGWDSPTLGS